MGPFKDIAVEKTGHVALIEIGRPPNNFFDIALIQEIAGALEALDADADCRAVVLAALGKAFCAGANFGDGARAAYERVVAAAKRHAPQARVEGVLVQPMAAPGREIILGVNRDRVWGPLLMVGLGGVLVEALGDVALAPVPLDHAAARSLLGRLKGAAILGPYRGASPADTDALVELIVRLSQFAADHADEIAEIDLNPVIVHAKGQGVSIVDALIVKQQPFPAQRSAAE